MVAMRGTRAARRSRYDAVRAALRLQGKDIELVVRQAEVRPTGPNDVVVAEGDVADRLYVIVRGKFVVSVSDAGGRRHPLRMLSAGQCFGETGLLDGGRRRATVTCATDDGELLVLSADHLGALLGGPTGGRRARPALRNA
jgi:CRP-like cAMP-binding protein